MGSDVLGASQARSGRLAATGNLPIRIAKCKQRSFAQNVTLSRSQRR
jgi:hypothetical protein